MKKYKVILDSGKEVTVQADKITVMIYDRCERGHVDFYKREKYPEMSLCGRFNLENVKGFYEM